MYRPPSRGISFSSTPDQFPLLDGYRYVSLDDPVLPISCRACGATVAYSQQSIHTAWHARQDDVAREIRKALIMARPSLDALSEKRSGTITNHEEIWLFIRDAEVPMTAKEIAEDMHLGEATVRRYLADLVEASYLGHGYSVSSRAKTYIPIEERP